MGVQRTSYNFSGVLSSDRIQKTISYHFASLSYEVGCLYGNLAEAFND